MNASYFNFVEQLYMHLDSNGISRISLHLECQLQPQCDDCHFIGSKLLLISLQIYMCIYTVAEVFQNPSSDASSTAISNNLARRFGAFEVLVYRECVGRESNRF